MHLKTPMALCLLAGTLSNAITARQAESTVTTTETLINGTSTYIPNAAANNPVVASDQLDQLATFAHNQTIADLQSNGNEKRGGCTLRNLAIRREWNTLSRKQRRSYTDAVLCLQSKRALTPSELIPGAKTRFDDWVGTHINQTNFIHYTGTFLAWHRWFIWHYEQALRNECGYKGYQPYWNWGLTAIIGLKNSPMLDGSDFSMSGDGEYVEREGDIILGGNGLPEIHLPLGTGGGCVTSGPFANMTVNLGPFALSEPNGLTVQNGNGLGYNPRCLKRDLTDEVNRRFANASSILKLIMGTHNVYDFQMQMQGVPGSGDIGVHGGGHYAMGGDPGRDVFTSPGDPLFYLHHAMIDRVWWIWQSLDRKTRMGEKGIAGTGTFLNNPPSANTTLDTPLSLGYAAGSDVKMADLMSTTDGPFCYIYV